MSWPWSLGGDTLEARDVCLAAKTCFQKNWRHAPIIAGEGTGPRACPCSLLAPSPPLAGGGRAQGDRGQHLGGAHTWELGSRGKPGIAWTRGSGRRGSRCVLRDQTHGESPQGWHGLSWGRAQPGSSQDAPPESVQSRPAHHISYPLDQVLRCLTHWHVQRADVSIS